MGETKINDPFGNGNQDDDEDDDDDDDDDRNHTTCNKCDLGDGL